MTALGFLCVLCIYGAPAVLSLPRSSPPRPLVYLQSGNIDVLSQGERESSQQSRRSLRQTQPKSPEWGPLAKAEQLLITYDKPQQQQVLAGLQRILQRYGGWLGGYVPDNSVLAVCSSTAAEAVGQLDGVIGVGAYKPHYKVSPAWQSILRDLPAADVSIAVSFPLLHNASSAGAPITPLFLPNCYNPGQAAAAEWEPEMAKAGLSASVSRWNQHLVIVTTAPRMLKAVLGWLSEHPSVHWVAPHGGAKLHNWQGTAITQSATAAPIAPVLLSQDQGTHPIWEAGLTGTDEVIGGGDSGIDYTNCYFADPSIDWNASLTTDSSSGALSFNSTAHRKIRLYRSLGNGIEAGGHGTHVMGSLLGSSLNTSDTYSTDYRGMAPDAKLAFTDLGSNSTDGIYTPQDLANDYFSYAYAVGARVHSDSWGSSSTTYDYMAAQVDLFTWQNQDFTSVFAAGNEGSAGASQDQGATTVTSPATAKNCITAGATEVAGQSFNSNPAYVTADMTLHQPVNTSDTDPSVGVYMVMQAGFGGQVSSLYGRQLPLSVANPRDGCSTLQNPAEITGTIVLIERGTCYMSSKVAAAQAAGAAAAMVFDNQINDYFLMLADGTSASSISIPAMAIPRRIGQLLVSSTESGGRLMVSFAGATTAPEAWANLAPFSSKGPTPDGRVKPDLLAPGTLQSAYTDTSTGNTCSLRTMQGTSMATPLIAGAAALVRQYFLGGRYPTGTTTPENAFQPSGALVKAVLIGGAAGLSGYEPDTGLPLAPPPSFRQGFGRVQLSQSLPLQGAGPGWSMQLVDMAKMQTGDSHQYCLNGTGGPLTVTLVWHDYPASLSAAKSLVNDLDLTVRAAGLNGIPLLGNGGDQGSDSVPDRTNNVEQVSLSYLPAGQISIQIDAHQVFSAQGPQPYALVVLGAFTGVLASPSNPVNGGNSTSAECKVVVAQIISGPEATTNETDVIFSFGLESGNNAGAAFECALSDGGGSSSSAAFTACTSPESYSNLTDGSYIFYIRAQGEQLADSRAFFKDTSPPQLTFLGQVPAPNTAAPIANFSFNATDLTPVTSVCRVSAEQTSTAQGNLTALQINGADLSSEILLGRWQPCVSPLALYWLLPGNWQLEISATDGAGNAAQQTLQHSWTVAFASESSYARFAKAPLGAVAASNQSFQLQALQNQQSGLSVIQSAMFECQLISSSDAITAADNLTAAAESVFTSSESLWQSCGGDAPFSNLADGDWAVAVRSGQPKAADEIAFTAFSVDSQAPLIEFTQVPGEFANSSSISIQFISNNTGVSFECLLIGQGNATAGNNSYTACASPAQWSSLSDGLYTFYLTGSDRVGNQAVPEETEFLVDTHAPVFSNIHYPVATQQSSLLVSFQASDGQLGSGVASTQCRLRSIKLASAAAAINQSSSPYGWRYCSSPYSYTGVEAGHWGLTLMATDHAGLQAITSEMDIWVENADPLTAVSAGPLQNRTVPAQIAFNFTSRSGSDIGTPIASLACRLVQISSETAGQVTGALQSNTSLPGACIDPAADGELAAQAASNFIKPVIGTPAWAQNASSVLPSSATGNLTALASAANPSPASLLAPGPLAISLQAFAGRTDDGWRNCSSPVMYKGLVSGNYSFQARAADAAGNEGAATDNYVFDVDANLPLSGLAKASFWGLGWKFWLVVGGGGLVVAALAGLCIWCCCRCKGGGAMRRAPHGTYISHEQLVATPRCALPTPRLAQLSARSSGRPLSARSNSPRSARSIGPLSARTERQQSARSNGPLSARTERHSSAKSGQPSARSESYDVDATAAALRLSLAQIRNTPPGSPTRHSALSSRHTSTDLATVATLEEAQLRQAIERSVIETRGPSSGSRLLPESQELQQGSLRSASSSGVSSPALLTARSSEAEDRALLASHRDHRDRDLHRALLLSLQEAAARSQQGALESPKTKSTP